MPFIPKSQYSIKHTNGGEFYNPRTGVQYKGEYIQYGTRYFAGNSILDLNTPLKRIEIPKGNMVVNKENFLYNQLNKPYYNKVKDQVAPIPSKPTPTKEDYKKGFWERYFCQRANNFNYIIEIDKSTYKKFHSNKISNVLYQKGKLNWSLQSGKINNDNILSLIRQYPNIVSLFNNPLEFIDNTNENLVAGLNELFYEDGTPYPEGSRYHIHPEKGPMEGAFHIEGPHAFLTFDRPQPEDEPMQYVASFTPPPVNYGGGGGGY